MNVLISVRLFIFLLIQNVWNALQIVKLAMQHNACNVVIKLFYTIINAWINVQMNFLIKKENVKVVNKTVKFVLMKNLAKNALIILFSKKDNALKNARKLIIKREINVKNVKKIAKAVIKSNVSYVFRVSS